MATTHKIKETIGVIGQKGVLKDLTKLGSFMRKIMTDKFMAIYETSAPNVEIKIKLFGLKKNTKSIPKTPGNIIATYGVCLFLFINDKNLGKQPARAKEYTCLEYAKMTPEQLDTKPTKPTVANTLDNQYVG